QKDAFSTQKEIIKKESEIISLKSELTNIKNELTNTKDELASKINEIECLGTLCPASQKTKDILNPVVMGGAEKNTQNEEQTEINDTSLTNQESLTNDISNIKNELVIKENETFPIIINKQNSESLIQDITIEGAVCAGEALVNDKKKFFIPSIEIIVMDSQFVIQKNRKKELPPMKLYLMDMDEATKHESSKNIGYPAMSWPFSKVFTGKSGTGKTNILRNIFVGNKGECIYKKKKGGSRYIRCNDLIVCGYHPDEPKWAFVRYIYGVIASDPKAPYYKNIRFKYISPKKIPSVKSFSPERSTVIIFEDLCVAPDTIQNRIILFFTHGCHRNISPIYVTQKYHHAPIIIRENLTHLVIFNGGSSYQDVSKIAGRYTDDVKNASMVINSYLRKGEFIVFDLNKAEDDPLAIRLRFDTPLDLQKEIELRQKHKIGSKNHDPLGSPFGPALQ
ncbi:21032_t:CDS:2, partial [Cetraspora pellucida]